MASLTPAQTAQVASWVAAGATLSQVQTRLAAELGVTMTFMDVRFRRTPTRPPRPRIRPPPPPAVR